MNLPSIGRLFAAPTVQARLAADASRPHAGTPLFLTEMIHFPFPAVKNILTVEFFRLVWY